MANRREYFFKQKVQEDELNAGFQGLEDADRAVITDSGFFGITFGLQLQQNSPTPNLNVRCIGAGAGFDQTGQRISIPSTQLVNVSVDSTSSPTAVAGSGNEKIVSVFIKFKRELSDPRIDGNSVTVYFVQDEGFEFIVAQGPEGPHPATPPAKLGDALLLGDITRTFGQTAIHNADISIARRDDQVVLESVNLPEIRSGTLPGAFAQLVSALDAFVSGSASLIAYGGGPNWADGTTNPASNVETQLNHIVSVLATGAGTAKIEGSSHADTPNSLSTARLDQQLAQLLSFINDCLQLTGGTLTGPLIMAASQAILPSANNQDLGGSGASHRWKGWLQDADVAGNIGLAGALNFASARTFHKLMNPNLNQWIGSTAGIDLSAIYYVDGDHTQLEVSGVHGGSGYTWTSVQQLELPQGAMITGVNFRWRTSNSWAHLTQARGGVFRQTLPPGTKQFFKTGGSVAGLDDFSPADGTNDVDQNVPFTLNRTGVADQPIDNTTYQYFVAFEFFALADLTGMRVYGWDITYTMPRGDEY